MKQAQTLHTQGIQMMKERDKLLNEVSNSLNFGAVLTSSSTETELKRAEQSLTRHLTRYRSTLEPLGGFEAEYQEIDGREIVRGSLA